ncbi:MAG TPA: hypothetical protein EYN89_02945 [Flavobacteriales bacterium]|nr:hypothetical protein [Flavobacteriales bacterium]
MKKQKIAIQGFAGSFHELATRNYFLDEDIELLYCDSFEEIFELIFKEKGCLGVIAIENTVAGSIMPNYKMLQEYNCKIIGETYLHIVQHLMAFPGQQLSDIREIWSHPMALRQCNNFLKKHPHIRSVETEDTAKSAEIINARKLIGVAAIAGEMAASINGLDIIKEGIETNKKNFTRFLVISPELNGDVKNSNKASICFTLDHETGSLAKVLVLLSENDLNLTKIQSNPIVGQEWEYFFYVDLLFENHDEFERTMTILKDVAKQLVVLGVYAAGNKPVLDPSA